MQKITYFDLIEVLAQKYPKTYEKFRAWLSRTNHAQEQLVLGFADAEKIKNAQEVKKSKS